MTVLPSAGSDADRAMLTVAVAEARTGLEEGGIPIGAALFSADGALLGRVTTAASSRATLPSTARRTRSATRAVSAPPAARRW